MSHPENTGPNTEKNTTPTSAKDEGCGRSKLSLSIDLRDWFAGQVAPGLIGAKIDGLGWKDTGADGYSARWQTNAKRIAEAAYELADAMLKEREKGDEAAKP